MDIWQIIRVEASFISARRGFRSGAEGNEQNYSRIVVGVIEASLYLHKYPQFKSSNQRYTYVAYSTYNIVTASIVFSLRFIGDTYAQFHDGRDIKPSKREKESKGKQR